MVVIKLLVKLLRFLFLRKTKAQVMQLVPIKVKIGLRANGHADHPDWTKLPMINNDSEVRQHCPSGWIYDKSSGHQENTPDSPFGQQFGVLLCTRKFANEAKATFPNLVTELNEVEMQDFYDNKANAHLAENGYNFEILESLNVELQLRKELGLDVTALKVKIAKAIDPNNAEAGIIKNKDRYWADYKQKHGFTV